MIDQQHHEPTGIVIHTKHIFMSNIPKKTVTSGPQIKTYNINAVCKFHNFIRTV